MLSTNKTEIGKVWLTNEISATVIIPMEIAKRHQLQKGDHILFQDTGDGIFMKKLKTAEPLT